MLTTSPPLEIFNFTKESNLKDWAVVDDVVMGGRSEGHLSIDSDGHGKYSGYVSLENNGGFSSLRYLFAPASVSGYQTCQIRIKGDRKNYQFRVKSSRNERHSYTYGFETSGEWQIIEVPLTEMTPSFRGRKLDMPNYPIETMEEVRFLIGNKIGEEFELIIDWIKLV